MIPEEQLAVAEEDDLFEDGPADFAESDQPGTYAASTLRSGAKDVVV